jgi:hypothetical protein
MVYDTNFRVIKERRERRKEKEHVVITHILH